MKWWVLNKKTRAVLGVIVKCHKNVGTLKNPHWKAWYCLESNEKTNADTRSQLAVFLAGGSNYVMEIY